MGIESSGRGADKPSEGNESQETPREDNPPRESEQPEGGGSRAETREPEQDPPEPRDATRGDPADQDSDDWVRERADHPHESAHGTDTSAGSVEAGMDEDLSFEEMKSLAEAEEAAYAKKEADGNLLGEDCNPETAYRPEADEHAAAAGPHDSTQMEGGENEPDQQADVNDLVDAPAGNAAEAGQAPRDEQTHETADDSDTQSEVDQPREIVEVERPHITQDYYTNIPPAEHERHLVRDPDNPTPIFDGPPERDQAIQGRIGDCGIISTFGAVAGHRPEAIQNSIKETGDGQYEVTMHDIDPATPEDPVARPTEDTRTYKVSDEFPVAADKEDRPLAGASSDYCGWPTLMEKVVAAEDQGWDMDKHADWDKEWVASKSRRGTKYWVDMERQGKDLPPSPQEGPLGYNRLDLGSTAYQRADLLTQVTGEVAEVRSIPGEEQGDQVLLEEFGSQLDDGKPILVGTRAEQHNGELFPENVESGHAYEVTKVQDGRIHMRNPWGDQYNPAPMDAKTFLEYYRWYNDDGTRGGDYTTLK